MFCTWAFWSRWSLRVIERGNKWVWKCKAVSCYILSISFWCHSIKTEMWWIVPAQIPGLLSIHRQESFCVLFGVGGRGWGKAMGKWEKSKMLCDLNYKSMSPQGCSKMPNIPCIYFHVFSQTQLMCFTFLVFTCAVLRSVLLLPVIVWDGLPPFKVEVILSNIFKGLGGSILFLPALDN